MNRRYLCFGLLVLAIMFLNVSQVLAETFTFDDFYPPVAHLNPVESGYAGLNWINFNAMDVQMQYSDNYPTGYVTGRVTPEFVIYNDNGMPAEFRSATPITFVSAYLTAAWMDGLDITVEGFLDSALIGTQTVQVSTAASQQFIFNYEGVNRVVFTPSGGTLSASSSGSGPFFVLDNLEITGDDPEVTTITIDIKPGNGLNIINPKKQGVIRVAILSSKSFDASTVNPATAAFGPGGTGALKAALEDVDRDGLLDMVLFFDGRRAEIACTDSTATLTARTWKIDTSDERDLVGTGSIGPVSCK
jgi:hypothetical protein